MEASRTFGSKIDQVAMTGRPSAFARPRGDVISKIDVDNYKCFASFGTRSRADGDKCSGAKECDSIRADPIARRPEASPEGGPVSSVRRGPSTVRSVPSLISSSQLCPLRPGASPRAVLFPHPVVRWPRSDCVDIRGFPRESTSPEHQVSTQSLPEKGLRGRTRGRWCRARLSRYFLERTPSRRSGISRFMVG